MRNKSLPAVYIVEVFKFSSNSLSMPALEVYSGIWVEKQMPAVVKIGSAVKISSQQFRALKSFAQ